MTSQADPSGARWVRAALQVNPFEYKGASSPSTHFEDEGSYNSALLDRCASEGIELIAITDHWCVDSSTQLAAAAQERGIVVMPGFEANTSEGIHLLVLFDHETPLSDVNAAIGQCGSEITPGCESGSAGDSYADIMEHMSARGALVIPAHANVSPRGLLTVLSGQPLAKMVKHAGLHAIAISPNAEDAVDQARVFEGTGPFDRAHELARIHADDICHPDRLGDPGGSTWIKMSRVGLDGIKHAVRTPQTRISLEDPASRQRALFKSLSWTGGFLDGVTVSFANDLTAFIGGRGTGKSTVIESLRYVLNIEPLGQAAKRDHLLIVNDVLERGTIIELVVDAVTPAAALYTIRRTVPDPPVVLDSSSSVTDLAPADVVVGRVEVFGQHELAEVAQQPANVARMISRFSTEPPPADSNGVRQDLRENRSRLAKVEKDQSELEEVLADVPRLEATVGQFEKAEWPTRLAEQQRLTQDEAIIAESYRRIAEAELAIANLSDSEPSTSLRERYEGLDDSPQVDRLRGVDAATKDLAATVESTLATLNEAVATARAKVSEIDERWKAYAEGKRGDHAEVIRELKTEGHDPDRLLATQQRLTQLRTRSTQREVLKSRRERLITERKELLEQMDAAEIEARRHLGRAVTSANAATIGSVRAKPVASPDREHLVTVVERRVTNSRKGLLEVVQQEDFSPKQFALAARSGTLADAFDFSDAQLAAIKAAGEPFLRELEEMTVDRAVEVSLNVGSESAGPIYKPLDNLSKGQKATALLLFLLSVSDSPLVIDQPEDDLDNRFVFAGIVRALRELKGQRQIVVSTHNANVPVLGDAELIVTLEGDGQRGDVNSTLTGSLDDHAVMRAAEDLLEGGHAAFDARRHLYGF